MDRRPACAPATARTGRRQRPTRHRELQKERTAVADTMDRTAEVDLSKVGDVAATIVTIPHEEIRADF